MDDGYLLFKGCVCVYLNSSHANVMFWHDSKNLGLDMGLFLKSNVE